MHLEQRGPSWPQRALAWVHCLQAFFLAGAFLVNLELVLGIIHCIHGTLGNVSRLR